MQIAEPLTVVAIIVPPSQECHTVTWLNEAGRVAGARQSVHRARQCTSREFIWSEDDQAMICLHCLTPKRGRP